MFEINEKEGVLLDLRKGVLLDQSYEQKQKERSREENKVNVLKCSEVDPDQT